MLTTVNRLQAFLYINLGEQMPEPILDEEGDIDVQADNEMLERWYFAREDYARIEESVLERFIIRTEQMLNDIENMPDTSESEDYMVHFYDSAKDVFNQDKRMIRTYFSWLYLLMLREHSGPRWGDFVVSYGQQNFVNMMRGKLEVL